MFIMFLLQPISYSSPRGGISQITVKGDTTTSFLLVQEASLTDSGSYACHASVGTVSQVMVHVIKSKKNIILKKFASLAIFGIYFL